MAWSCVGSLSQEGNLALTIVSIPTLDKSIYGWDLLICTLEEQGQQGSREALEVKAQLKGPRYKSCSYLRVADHECKQGQWCSNNVLF